MLSPALRHPTRVACVALAASLCLADCQLFEDAASGACYWDGDGSDGPPGRRCTNRVSEDACVAGQGFPNPLFGADRCCDPGLAEVIANPDACSEGSGAEGEGEGAGARLAKADCLARCDAKLDDECGFGGMADTQCADYCGQPRSDAELGCVAALGCGDLVVGGAAACDGAGREGEGEGEGQGQGQGPPAGWVPGSGSGQPTLEVDGGNPAAFAYANGGVQVWMRGRRDDPNLYTRYRSPDGTWTPWYPLPVGEPFHGEITVAGGPGGDPLVLVASSDRGDLYAGQVRTLAGGQAFSGFEPLDLPGIEVLRPPAAHRLDDGRLRIFQPERAQGSGPQRIFARDFGADRSWGSWTEIGAAGPAPYLGVAAASDGAGGSVVIVVDDQRVSEAWSGRVDGGGSFLGWDTLGHPEPSADGELASAPALHRFPDGALALFVVSCCGADGIWSRHRPAGGTWQPWQAALDAPADLSANRFFPPSACGVGDDGVALFQVAEAGVGEQESLWSGRGGTADRGRLPTQRRLGAPLPELSTGVAAVRKPDGGFLVVAVALTRPDDGIEYSLWVLEESGSSGPVQEWRRIDE